MAFSDLKAKIINNKKYILIFLIILMVGIFLRTYHYGDYMRFGKDQARDAGIVRDVLSGNQPIPLIGPLAGGTDFKMGPIFYYFQLASAKLFGFSVNTIAYPDLFFSLLTIPVFLFFMKKYFNNYIALSLTALFGLSFFAVQNGRFAWNPNSLPLFSMLFLLSLLELVDDTQKRNFFWAIVGGVALGIGVQLHTLFILIMGITAVIFSSYFVWKKKMSLKNIAIIIFIALLLNVPQLVSEIKTGGQNTKAFFSGIGQKSVEKNDYHENSHFLDIYWHIQSNSLFVSAFGDDSGSDFLKIEEKIGENKDGIGFFAKNASLVLEIVLGICFSAAGYMLLFFYGRKEKDQAEKNFLGLVILFASVSFLVMIPLSHVLVLRYFLMLQFMPFLMLGLMAVYLQNRFGKKGLIACSLVAIVLLSYNIYAVFQELNSFGNGKGDLGIAIWNEEDFAGQFLLTHLQSGQWPYFIYEPQNANKFIRSLSYFNDRADAPLIPSSGTPTDSKDAAYFTLVVNRDSEKKAFKRKLDNNIYEITDSAFFGRIAIYSLKLK